MPAILIFLTTTVASGFDETARLRQEVSRSYETRAALQSVLSLHQDLELGQRGYIITANSRFLEPYRAAYPQMDHRLAELSQPQEIGEQHALIAELVEVSAEKRRFVDRTIALVRDGRRAEAERLVSGGEGKRLMDRIRALIASASEVERAKLEQRTEHANTARAALREQTMSLQLVLVLLLTVAAFLIARGHRARQEALSQARDSATRQETIFDSAKDGMIVLNPSGSIESLNPAAARIFGFPSEALMRRDIGSLFEIAPDRGQVETFLRRLGANRRETYGDIQEFIGRRADGTTFPLEVSVGPVHMADRTLYLAVLRDISERREVEQMKSEFVATVSHELRTPLTSIAGSLGLITGGAAGEIPDKARRLVEIAHSNAARLVRLINDILDIEKIEAGRMQFDIRPLPLAPLFNDVIDQTAGFAGEYDVEVKLQPFESDAAVLADADRLMQVMTNLLSNAIKFSARGEEVTIGVTPLDRRYRISVADRGSGIPQAFQSRIFSKFAQADGSDTRQKGGTGLGLSIVREIVVRLGGAVSFDSIEGRGTTFHVDLPMATPPEAALQIPAATEGRDDGALPLVLHVDDDPDMLAVVANIFEGRAQLRSLPSIASARAAIRSEDFDAAILDIGMSDGNGIDLATPLRGQKPDMPIILFTAQEIDLPASDIDLVLVKSRASLDTLLAAVMDRIAAAKDRQRTAADRRSATKDRRGAPR